MRSFATLLLLLLLTVGANAGRTQVGMMYEGWHAPAYWGRSPFATNATVEDVVRSNSTMPMQAAAPTDAARAMGFWWHKQPAAGFYCIYRKRSTENVSSCGLPDCPNIAQTLARHAKMLTDVGVDFIVADSTNIQSAGAGADALQLRPWNVVGEEWLKLRKLGIATPKIAIWQNLQSPTGNLWKQYVNGEYADAAYDELIFKDETTGKKVLFTTANPTQAIVDEIEKGGNIVVVTMWAERDNFAKGEWAFFSPCRTTSGLLKQKHAFTSTVLSDGTPCNQALTTNSPIGQYGTSLTVGPSYQLSYSSLPFRASGKLRGLTLKKQFERAFAEHAKGKLDYLQLGTFNEHIAQPQVNKFGAWVRSMGLENDTQAIDDKLWVDMYGDGITRDLEPTVQDDGFYWKLFESCMRVFHAGAASCSNMTEPCCLRGAADPASTWTSIYALTDGGAAAAGGDSLLTKDTNELKVLTAKGWAQTCQPMGGYGAAQFCTFAAGNAPTAANYTSGPFLIHSFALPDAGASKPAHRCVSTAGKKHFVSSSSHCSGVGSAESILGHVSQHRSTETPRSLRACTRGGAFWHSLDAPCAAGARLVDHLGFVK